MPAAGAIPGDPAALEAGAQVYSAAAEGWQALRSEVSALAFGLAGTPDWSGEAATAFNASAQGLVEVAERGASAMREGAGALRAYTNALEQAQAAYAQASTEQAAAEAEQSVARQAVRGVAGDSLIPPPLLSRLDMADAGVAAAARAASAAVEEAQRAAQEAAAAFRGVAAQANPAAEQGTAGEGEDGGGVLRWLGRAAVWPSEQLLGRWGCSDRKRAERASRQGCDRRGAGPQPAPVPAYAEGHQSRLPTGRSQASTEH